MVCLNNLTEYQKSLLTRLAYLNVDFGKFKATKEYQNKIIISDLKFIVSDANEPYIGSLHVPQIKIMLTNIGTTTLEFLEEVENAGLGELEIIDLDENKENGFNAICFKDSENNVGFSYRGTDIKTFSSLVVDGLADIEAFLTNNTIQINQAECLFNQYKNLDGKNYIYGHSLGGFLAENVYLRRYEEIANAFVVNPLHINSELLDDEKKVEAFNDKNKFSCFVTGGDYVSLINKPELFTNNVHYVQNSSETANNPLGNHMIESGLFDEEGSFVRCKEGEAFIGHESKLLQDTIDIINNNKVKVFFGRFFNKVKSRVNALKIYLGKLFRKDKKDNDVLDKTNVKSGSTDFEEYINPDSYKKINRLENMPKPKIKDKEEELIK